MIADNFSDCWHDLAQRGLELNAERYAFYSDWELFLKAKWGMAANWQGGKYWKQECVEIPKGAL